MRLKRFHHVAGQNVRPMLLARVKFNGHFAVNAIVYAVVEFDEMFGIDMLGEINLGF